ncbi:MAG: hypothetical protein AAF268_01490 [Cyanobacteria bacterium P01_A01_bin.3]
MSLSDKIQDPDTKANMADDCAKLLDEQVSSKNGLSGLTVKTAYRALKGIGPTYVPRALQRLLPKALDALEPLWMQGLAKGEPVEFLSSNRTDAADALLTMTDGIVSTSKNKIVVAAYKQVRKSLKGDVETAIPGLAEIIQRHT